LGFFNHPDGFCAGKFIWNILEIVLIGGIRLEKFGVKGKKGLII